MPTILYCLITTELNKTVLVAYFFAPILLRFFVHNAAWHRLTVHTTM